MLRARRRWVAWPRPRERSSCSSPSVTFAATTWRSIAFRGTSADVLLPPTRSLVRVKRELASLPGGGATPLAAGIGAAFDLARAVMREGRSPVIALLTDGRGNIARDGTADRPRATQDSLAVARLIRAAAIAAIVIDVSPRPGPQAARLAAEMGAGYVPLPHADAGAIAGAVMAATEPSEGTSVSDRLQWRRDGRDWPNRAFSRFVRAGGIEWHVQEMGQGPKLLLLHGTAASTHSFRALAPLLAPHFTLLIPDLPGHAFTETPAETLTLPTMRDLVSDLLAELSFAPDLAAGHSAGAAILVRMALDGAFAPRRIVSLNGALLPFPGVTGQVAAPRWRGCCS